MCEPRSLGVEPLRFLAVHPDAFPQQQDVQPPIAEAPTLPGQLAQPPTQLGIVAAPTAVSNRRPIRAHDAARPPLAHPKARLEMRDLSRKRYAFRRLRAWRRASPFFSKQVLQICVVEHGLSQQPLQLGVPAHPLSTHQLPLAAPADPLRVCG